MLMTWLVAGVLAVHGFIHLMGFAKAFGFADLPQLAQPISRTRGLAWLVAAILVLASAVMFGLGHRRFFMVGAAALFVSQMAISFAWRDAWAGTVANAILLLLIAHGWLTEGPRSFHAQLTTEAQAGLAKPIDAPLVTESDLAPLPDPVRRYLRHAGIVGQPRVRNYRLRFRGRIRSAPDSAWMPFEAEQQSFTDPPTRLFLMRARMFGLPVEAFHRLADGHATMQVKVVGIVPMVDARGDVMDRSETVTLLNDMCLLAPGTLLEPTVVWEPVDARTVRARFTNGAHTIAATLFFDEDGLLTNFESSDRSRVSPDGKTFTQLPFSTPVRDYRSFGAERLAARGDAVYTLPDGPFTYGEFELVDIAYNVLR